MVKKRKKKRTSSRRKPIGFTKVRGKYRLVFGSKKKPVLGKNTYRSKSGIARAARKYFPDRR